MTFTNNFWQNIKKFHLKNLFKTYWIHLKRNRNDISVCIVSLQNLQSRSSLGCIPSLNIQSCTRYIFEVRVTICLLDHFSVLAGKAAVDRYSLEFEFQLPHSNLANNMLKNDTKQKSCSLKDIKIYIYFHNKNLKTTKGSFLISYTWWMWNLKLKSTNLNMLH